jgi:prephenate dehydrogenase
MHGELNKRVVAQLGSGIRRIAIFGTGLIGASIGLALREAGYTGVILGWDPEQAMLARARAMGAIDQVVAGDADDDPFVCALAADVIVLAGPVFTIAEWLEQLAPVLSPTQLVTDVGSVKGFLVQRAAALYNGDDQASWLPGHPMAGKETSGAASAEAALFKGATWLFTGARSGKDSTLPEHPYLAEWLRWVEQFGARAVVLTPERHDLLCASVSHLPQMLSSAFASMLQQQFEREFVGEEAALHGIGGRALREMTRLGASPYSMWRDIAMTNEGAIAASLLAMEQELAHLRENLRTAELRELFAQANAFRAALIAASVPKA